MASPGNRHCANRIRTLSFPITEMCTSFPSNQRRAHHVRPITELHIISVQSERCVCHVCPIRDMCMPFPSNRRDVYVM